MRILVSTSLLSPYRVDWLNELGKYSEVDILYLEEGNKERNQEWLAKRPENCRYQLMRGLRFPVIGKISFDIIKRMRQGVYDIVICDGYGFATQLINMLFLNRNKINYFMNVDGAVPKDKENLFVSWMKRRILSAVPFFLCGSKETGEILVGYGANRDKIIHHHFSSLYKDDLYSSVLSEVEKFELRRKLCITEKNVIISVGRFSYLNGYGKGYDVLLRVASRLKNSDIGWYIVGGKPTEEFEEMTSSLQLTNVHYIDFKPKEELKEYYRAADIFVLMTVGDVWGLVINEAMACGLPVITTNKCVAGVELVEEGKNGYIVNVGDDNALELRIKGLIDNPSVVADMGKASIDRIQEYTIESMARTHIDAFNKVVNG